MTIKGSHSNSPASRIRRNQPQPGLGPHAPNGKSTHRLARALVPMSPRGHSSTPRSRSVSRTTIGDSTSSQSASGVAARWCSLGAGDQGLVERLLVERLQVQAHLLGELWASGSLEPVDEVALAVLRDLIVDLAPRDLVNQ